MYTKIVTRFVSVIWIFIQFSSILNVNAKVESDQIYDLNNRLYNELANILLQRIGKSLAQGLPLEDIPKLDPLIIEEKLFFLSQLEVPGLSGFIKFSDVEINGLTNVVLKDFELIQNEAEDTAVISGKLTFPQISVVLYYSFAADYFPLFDNFCVLGKFSAGMTDFIIDGETQVSIFDEEFPIYKHDYDISTSVGSFTVDVGYTGAC
ncbi:hemolymph juvenile hormone binding protein (JHBP) [Popillia japonica]|uniref:Hemolymph juvenile hormone binding protein (JHBP) n=1 Tax=Popillia japonica TaxID=7064 RepID=A0AAW1IX75_POPJA